MTWAERLKRVFRIEIACRRRVFESPILAYESIRALSETDFTEDLKKIDVPT